MADGAVVTSETASASWMAASTACCARSMAKGWKARVKRQIIEHYGPELPVGAAVVARSEHDQLVIYAPTMQIPDADRRHG